MSDEIRITCPKCHETTTYDLKNNSNISIDMMGENIRAEALKNLQENLIKCSKCQTTFCLKCNSMPYHEGSTCEEQKLVAKNIICRFCHEYPAIGCENLDPCHYVCWHEECKENMSQACMHLCDCGHACCGLFNENNHFGCPICKKALSICSICKRSSSISPSVIMKCGHPVHKACLEQYYKSLSDNGRIIIPRCDFNYTCQEIPYHECVNEIAQKWINLNSKIEEMIKLRMELEDTKHEKKYVCNPNDTNYFNQPLKFANDYFVFYLCNKCHQPYYAGHKDCRENDENNSNYVHKCPRCDVNFLNANCPKHGETGMIFKCMFCCKPALFNCGQYYCEECHKDPSKAQRGPHPSCNGKCQFYPHSPNGEQKVIGYCTICEDEKEKSKLINIH